MKVVIIARVSTEEQKEAAPLRELKTMIGKNKPQSWNRLINEATKIRLPTMDNPFKEIRKCIEEFKAIKLK
jgi:hypothetical protein